MSDLECDAGALRAAATVLGGVGDRVRDVRDGGSVGDVEVWGVLGRVTGAAAHYSALAVSVDGHLDAAAEFCERADAALRQVAGNYEAAEQRSARGFPGGCDDD